MKLSLIVLSLLLPSLSFAACVYGENNDLRKVNPKVFNLLPVHDQGDTGLCYAYSATTLLDFVRIKQTTGAFSNMSPLEAGLITTMNRNLDSEYGGRICDAVNSLINRGYGCNKAFIDEKLFYHLGLKIHTELVGSVLIPYITNQEVFPVITPAQFTSQKNLNDDQRTLLVRLKYSYVNIQKLLRTEGFQASAIPTEKSILALIQRIHLSNRYSALRMEFNHLITAKICENAKLHLTPMKCTPVFEESRMMSSIDHALMKREPVGFTYCANVLTQKRYVGMDAGVMKETCHHHASVIIGKKSDTTSGQCFYLIRNSWGKNKTYDWEQSEGDIWVEEEALTNNLTGVSVIN